MGPCPCRGAGPCAGPCRAGQAGRATGYAEPEASPLDAPAAPVRHRPQRGVAWRRGAGRRGQSIGTGLLESRTGVQDWSPMDRLPDKHSARPCVVVCRVFRIASRFGNVTAFTVSLASRDTAMPSPLLAWATNKRDDTSGQPAAVSPAGRQPRCTPGGGLPTARSAGARALRPVTHYRVSRRIRVSFQLAGGSPAARQYSHFLFGGQSDIGGLGGASGRKREAVFEPSRDVCQSVCLFGRLSFQSCLAVAE